MKESERARVQGVTNLKTQTIILLNSGREVELGAFIYVKRGDILEFSPRVGKFKSVWKITTDKAIGVDRRVCIYPPYSKVELLHIPPHRIEICIRERHNSADWERARPLEQFHYRGQGFNRIVGRRTALIAEASTYGLIGYGVLSATLAAARPRFRLFKTDFTNQMRTRLINRIARIPRIVVHPEFRGIGVGRLIAKHLVEYAKERWDINGYTPILIEVMASMLEYHAFFENAGFVRVGYTEGYEEGIFPKYGQGTWQARPNHDKYEFLGHQKPKPYLAYPLTKETKGLLRESGLMKSKSKQIIPHRWRLSSSLFFAKVTLEYKARNGTTARSEEVREVFGVNSSQICSPVLRNFSLRIDPGDVVLVKGASGSGKSSLIWLLNQPMNEIRKIARVSGRVPYLRKTCIASLNSSYDMSKPLIEQIGRTTKDAIEILNGVGLGEAHLYVKRVSQISDGQRYRFAVAILCDSEKPIWVADEFAATLDPLTAAVLSKGLRKAAWLKGATVVLAAPHVDNFLGSLLPTKIVNLRWGGESEVRGIRLLNKSHERYVELQAVNTGSLPLTGVSLYGIQLAGRRVSLSNQGELNRGKRSSLVQIPLRTIRGFTALCVTCKEAVGDVVYLSQQTNVGQVLSGS